VPHALDLEQIAVVKGNIEEWAGKTLSTMKIVEDQTTELLE